MKSAILFLTVTIILASTRVADAENKGYISKIEPNQGSYDGGTLLHITGVGFSKDQFSYDNPILGNVVILRNTRSQGILPCFVIQTDTTETRITCETAKERTQRDQDYTVEVKVDGSWLSGRHSGCYHRGHCKFYYRSSFSPTLSYVSPRSSNPEKTIALHGKILTTQISRLSKEFKPGENVQEISKIFVNDLCEPFDIETGKLLGVYKSGPHWHSAGWIKCQPTVKVPGSWNVTFIVSNAGRSRRDKNTFLVDSNDEVYSFQTFADVESMDLKNGSREGGQTLTIKGKYFGKIKENIDVRVRGVPCKVTSFTTTEIKCITGAVAGSYMNDNTTVYPGGRGAHIKVWHNQGRGRSNDDMYKWAQANENKIKPYLDKIDTDFANIAKDKWGGNKRIMGKFSGFIVPPYTGKFRVYIYSDDRGALYMSKSGSRTDDLERKAYCRGATSNWFSWPEQGSEFMELKKDRAYYFEAHVDDGGGSYYMSVGLWDYKTRKNASQAQGVYDEMQRIHLTSTHQDETHQIHVKKSSGSFKLSYGDYTSDNINIKDLTAAKLRSGVDKIFSSKCSGAFNQGPLTHDDTAFFYENYEGASRGGNRWEKGYRETNVPAYCGRKYLRFTGTDTPWYAGNTYKKDMKNRYGYWPVTKYPMFCLGYYGRWQRHVNVHIYYTRKDGRQENKRRTYAMLDDGEKDTWKFSCVNVYQQFILTDKYLTDRFRDYTKPTIRYIQLRRHGDQSTPFIDEVYIGTQTVTPRRTKAGLQPEGFPVTQVSVSDVKLSEGESGKKFNVAFKVGSCGNGLKVLKSSNTGLATIKRVVTGSSKVKGSFSLGYEGKEIKDIPHDISAANLKAMLEEKFNTGRLGVTFSRPSCRERYWEVEWKEVGGKKELMTIDGSKVTALKDPKANLYRRRDGGLMRKLTGEFTRTKHDKPQVVVTVNGIASSCNGQQCSYEYLQAQTPSVTSITPTTGVGGAKGTCTELTIACQGCSATSGENKVHIGDAECIVTSESATEIKCCPAQSQAGEKRVRVTVAGKGYATGDQKFKYTIAVNSVSPSAGSVTGGIKVNIAGAGFGTTVEGVSVSIGNSKCTVKAVTMTQITCVTTSHAAGKADVVVTVGEGEAKTLASGFTYTTGNAPVITSVTSKAYTFGSQITIKGTGLMKSRKRRDTSGDDGIDITIGGKSCNVTSKTSTEVQCTAPSFPPGDFELVYELDGQGDAKFEGASSTIKYELQIDSISPTVGSIVGGTEVTITGKGFSNNITENVITIAGKPCQVKTSSLTSLTCVTGSSGVHHEISNNGIHSLYGLGYEWSRTNLYMNIGDKVTWYWASNPLSNQKYGVYSTAKATDQSYDGRGFVCGKRPSGECTWQFSSAGVYHYTSGKIATSNSHSLQGILQVQAAQDKQAAVRITIAGITQPPLSKNLTTDSALPKFQYQVAKTPAVTNVTSRRYKIDEKIVIKGRLFSTNKAKNIVKFGSHLCTVTDATATELKCKMDVSSSPPINKQLMVSVLVEGVGNAIIEIAQYFDMCVWLDPVIDSLTTAEGSFGGGTEVTINGKGFTSKEQIKLPEHLIYLSHTYTALKVRTVRWKKQGKEWKVATEIKVNNADAACRDTKELCKFKYDDTKTHTISKVAPESTKTASTTFTITGTKFGTKKSDLEACVTMQGGSNEDIHVERTTCTKETGFCVTWNGQDQNTGVTSLGKVYGAACLSACQARQAAGNTVTGCEEIVNKGCYAHSMPVSRGNGQKNNYCYVFSKCQQGGSCYKTCDIQTVSDTEVTCKTTELAAGYFGVRVVRKPWGRAYKASGIKVLSQNDISAVEEEAGSTYGGALVNIKGYGFSNDVTHHTVTLSGTHQEIVSAAYDKIVIRTSAANGNKQLVVRNVWPRSVTHPQKTYSFSGGATPKISSISPKLGKSGDKITITGENFNTDISDTHVTIGDSKCVVSSVVNTKIECTLAVHPAGTHNFRVRIGKLGLSNIETFTYTLGVTSVTPAESGYGGRRLLTLSGHGFSKDLNVTICGSSCQLKDPKSVTDTKAECYSPHYEGWTPSTSTDQVCDTIINHGTETKTLSKHYTYKSSLTSEVTNVSPRRGGTGGGVKLTITGTDFDTTPNATRVEIAGKICKVKTIASTEVVCITAAAPGGPYMKTNVIVTTDSKGAAYPSNATFSYIDVWSSKYSWGGEAPPSEGQMVVIPAGHTMLLDQNTPKLKILLIKGGTFMFDDEKDIELNAEHIMIVEDGKFLVGESEAKPYQHNAKIILHGHVRSKELPVYGAKTLAVRKGHLGLYGKHILHTWTHIMKTINPGDTEIELKHPATGWNIGDEIVIPTSSKRQAESEVVKITAKSQDGLKLTFSPAVKYQHISVVQTIGGKTIETRCEVGLLSRNIVVEGNVEQSWVHEIKACPSDHDPRLMAVQTCFDGKFGAERGSDQYGVQIMVHSHKKHKGQNMATAHFHYIEVRHCGQAFRLGRYPIHFHMEGDTSGSYVEGNSVHHSFNRAITMHGVRKLRVERNVFFNVMGNALFMEDGNEIQNTVQYNLGIFVRPSSSSLNVDISPATYWITNADNIIQHNVAAGGSHFGYWFQMFPHPEGPNFDPKICPRKVPMTLFRNNSAHSFAVNGLWVFPTFTPMKGGGDYENGCNANVPEPAKFEDFLGWNNLQAAEMSDGGALQLIRPIALDNSEAGLNFVHTTSKTWGHPLIQDAIVSGHSKISEEMGDTKSCSKYGVRFPPSPFMSLKNVTFHNFDRPDSKCVALGLSGEYYKPGRAGDFIENEGLCATGPAVDGGYEARLWGIKWLNVPRKVWFTGTSSFWFQDMDGSATGAVGGAMVPYMPTLDPTKCTQQADVSAGKPGAMCKSPVTFRKIAWNGMERNNPLNPQNNHMKPAFITNEHGTYSVGFLEMKCKDYNKGWTALGIVNTTMEIHFNEGFHNLSYSMGFNSPYKMNPNEWMIIKHNFSDVTHGWKTLGSWGKSLGRMPTFNDKHGDFWYDNTTYPHANQSSIYYLVKGRKEGGTSIQFRSYKCYFKDCITPTQPPVDMQTKPWKNPKNWSDVSVWSNPVPGFAGNRLPRTGDNVQIKSDMNINADVKLPFMKRLDVFGILTLVDGIDQEINADILYVGGRFGELNVGSPEKPMLSNVLISLTGDKKQETRARKRRSVIGTRQYMRDIGSRALGIFTKAKFFGKPRKPYWTRLAKTLNKNGNQIEVVEDTDWQVGEDIVITPTSYSRSQDESFKIVARNSPRSFTLDKKAKYKHIASSFDLHGRKFEMSAKVAMMSRNIKIRGANHPNGTRDVTKEDSYGCHIYVGKYSQKGYPMVGSAAFSNVEFSDCSQASTEGESWEFPWDPRYAISFNNLGTVNKSENFIKGCSFTRGGNLAIGTFETNGVDIEDNILHQTYGFWSTGYGFKFERNLFINNGGAIAKGASTFIGNVHSGGKINPILLDFPATFLFKIPRCSDTASHTWQRDNEVHSSPEGIFQFRSGPAGCIRHWLLWKNGYGHFSWTPNTHVLENMILSDNKNAIFMGIFGASSLQHKIRDSRAIVRNSLIIGTSSANDCTSGPVQGFLSNKFSITQPPPCVPREDPRSYPMINGVTQIHSNVLMNFNNKCGGRSYLNRMQALWLDYIHPVEFFNNTAVDIDQKSFAKYNVPTTVKISPADCVDMDCEGTRKWLIEDKDGSITGTPGTQFLPKSEYEWDGNRAFGLGNMRIPKTMVTTLQGKRIDADKKYPNKGIMRGRGGKNQCTWDKEGFNYQCTGLGIRSLMLESLDKDTESRRLSPIGIGSNGYIDLINGPQDHGWCNGWFCLKRLSMFHALVANQTITEVFLSSTNPQKFRMKLLNADMNFGMVVEIFYANPQRLDIYNNGLYVYPTNAYFDKTELKFRSKDQRKPTKFIPSFNTNPGANWFDLDSNLQYVLMKGDYPIEIRTQPVVQLRMGTEQITVDVDDFFEENIIRNLALLLFIKPEDIRIMNVVSANEGKRRRRGIGGALDNINIQFGSPPSNTSNSTQKGNDTSGLLDMSSRAVEASQTGSLSDTLGIKVGAMNVKEPEPEADEEELKPPVIECNATKDKYCTNEAKMKLQSLSDKEYSSSECFQSCLELTACTGFSLVRSGEGKGRCDLFGGATCQQAPNSGHDFYNKTDCRQIFEKNFDDKSSTAGEKQKKKEETRKKATAEVKFLIPSKISMINKETVSKSGFETVPLAISPELRMFDANGEWVENLGTVRNPWIVTVSIVNGTGTTGAYLMGNKTTTFVNGTAKFGDMAISHAATGYKLLFNVTYPSTVVFSVEFGEIEVKERNLRFDIVHKPITGIYELQSITPAFSVSVVDVDRNELVTNTGWKGREWRFEAEIVQGSGALFGNFSKGAIVAGKATLGNVSIDTAGAQYKLKLKAFTVPSSKYSSEVTTAAFEIKEREFYVHVDTQPSKCFDTLECVHQPVVQIKSRVPDMLATNLGWKGRTWHLNTTECAGTDSNALLGTTYHQFPASGVISHTDLKFNNVGPKSGPKYKFCFKVVVSPADSKYDSLTAQTNEFSVTNRQFYLAVDIPPGDANETAVFGQQPVIAVRVEGSGKKGWPLPQNFSVVASLSKNPGGASLSGNLMVPVSWDERVNANFSDLLLDKYQAGYELTFVASGLKNGITIKSAKSPLFNVRYKNFHRPVFNSNSKASINVLESASTGVLQNFTATDQDTGVAGDIKYNLTGEGVGSVFSINPTSGQLSLVAGLDRENKSSYSLIVQAIDKAPSPFEYVTSHSLTVIVDDVNDNTPTFANSVVDVTIKETESINSVVASLVATDADAGNNAKIVYSIVSDNSPSGQFSLDSATGTLKLTKSADLDAGQLSEPTYKLVIKAEDQAVSSKRSSQVTVNLKISHVNEFTPTFKEAKKSVTIPEDKPAGYVLWKNPATDGDAGIHGEVRYFASPSPPCKFCFLFINGTLSLEKQLDFEALTGDPVYTITLHGTDKVYSGYAKKGTAQITVTLTDVNDNKPVFDTTPCNVTVKDTTEVGMTLFKVMATDADSGVNSKITMSLSSSSLFSYTAGMVKVKSALNQVTERRTVDVNVVATDGGSPALSSTKTCQVTIVPPQITKKLIVTFDVDYDATVKGKEAEFKKEFEAFYVAREKSKGRHVELSNIKVEKGSVKVTFDVLHEKHQSDQLVSDLKSDISTGLNFKFKAKALKTMKTLSVDGKSVAVIAKAESKSNTAVIAAVVVVVLLLIIVGAVLVFTCHFKGYYKKKFGKKSAKVEHLQMDEHTSYTNKSVEDSPKMIEQKPVVKDVVIPERREEPEVVIVNGDKLETRPITPVEASVEVVRPGSAVADTGKPIEVRSETNGAYQIDDHIRSNSPGK